MLDLRYGRKVQFWIRCGANPERQPVRVARPTAVENRAGHDVAEPSFALLVPRVGRPSIGPVPTIKRAPLRKVARAHPSSAESTIALFPGTYRLTSRDFEFLAENT